MQILRSQAQLQSSYYPHGTYNLEVFLNRHKLLLTIHTLDPKNWVGCWLAKKKVQLNEPCGRVPSGLEPPDLDVPCAALVCGPFTPPEPEEGEWSLLGKGQVGHFGSVHQWEGVKEASGGGLQALHRKHRHSKQWEIWWHDNEVPAKGRKKK